MRCSVALLFCMGLAGGSAVAADQPGGGHPPVAKGGGKTQPKAAQRQPGRAGNAANQPRQQIQRLLDMKPEAREKFLQTLPADRRKNVEKTLGELDKMPPEARSQYLERAERLGSLPPEKQQQVRRSLRMYQNLPPDRQALIARELKSMAAMPDEQRRERMNSEEFRNRYSVTEQEMMSNLSEIASPRL